MKPLTPKEMDRYKRSERCHICFKPFKEDKPKVRDYCHYAGRDRGPAHTKCNLQYKIPSYIPVMFHNLSGYDAHLFIKELAASSTDGPKMGVISKNKEDYISFSIKVEVDKYIDKNGIEKSKEIELRFIDSFKFMSSSLDSLINNLARGGGKFFGFEEYNENQYKLLIQKGIYPYEYRTNWDKFKETKLPPREAFYSKLNMAGVREELLLDPDMLLMFERGIRGGITQSVNRWAKANNPYMGSEFDPDEKTNYLQYLNANNLYGWAMSQPLPTGGFRWVDIKPDKISKLAKRKSKGYLLEVDVRYPKELHDSHNDLPFMCERMKINGVEKLIPNLYDKMRYVIHIRALDQALKHGLVLERIHKAIEFKQLAWMKEYIDFNTKLRTAATNDFAKDSYKLMNNSVFEKPRRT